MKHESRTDLYSDLEHTYASLHLRPIIKASGTSDSDLNHLGVIYHSFLEARRRQNPLQRVLNDTTIFVPKNVLEPIKKGIAIAGLALLTSTLGYGSFKDMEARTYEKANHYETMTNSMGQIQNLVGLYKEVDDPSTKDLVIKTIYHTAISYTNARNAMDDLDGEGGFLSQIRLFGTLGLALSAFGSAAATIHSFSEATGLPRKYQAIKDLIPRRRQPQLA